MGISSDVCSGGSCAIEYKGGWWHDKCHESNLNSLYFVSCYADRVNWVHYKGYSYSLK